MGKLRFWAALIAAKLSIVALKITRHNGTNFPGVVALKICPQFIKYIGKPKKVIAVSGTNGKTTTCNMILDAFNMEGRKVVNNRMGSNINSGIATSLIQNASITGRCKEELGILKWMNVRRRGFSLPYTGLHDNYKSVPRFNNAQRTSRIYFRHNLQNIYRRRPSLS